MKQYHGTYARFFLFHVSDDRALCKPGCASLVVIHWYSWRFWWWLVMFVFIDLKWPRVFRCSTPSCYSSSGCWHILTGCQICFITWWFLTWQWRILVKKWYEYFKLILLPQQSKAQHNYMPILWDILQQNHYIFSLGASHPATTWDAVCHVIPLPALHWWPRALKSSWPIVECEANIVMGYHHVVHSVLWYRV